MPQTARPKHPPRVKNPAKRKFAAATSFGGTRGLDPIAAAKRVAKEHIAVGVDVRIVRQRFREAAARSLARLEKIAMGKLTIPVRTVGADGVERVEQAQPVIAEQLRAIESLAKYGVGTPPVEVTGPNGGPMQVQHITVTRRIVHGDDA